MSCRHRWAVIMALLIPNLDARFGLVFSATHWRFNSLEGYAICTLQVAHWATGPPWTGVERRKYFAPGASLEPRSVKPVGSLYWLRYPVTHRFCYFIEHKRRTPYIVWFAINGRSVVAKIHFLGYKVQNFKYNNFEFKESYYEPP
jgi:hypothetical protein